MTIGQTLYFNSKDGIVEHHVAKIGKKYFYVDRDLQRCNFALDTLKYIDKNYSQSNRQLYLTKQEILDKNELEELGSKIKQVFYQYSRLPYTLQQLRIVAQTLEIK